MKQKLARYNLQFCAVNSQLGQHDTAIHSAQKAHQLLQECINGCSEEFKRIWLSESCSPTQINTKMNLLLGLTNYSKKIELSSESSQQCKQIMKATHASLQIWGNQKGSQNIGGQNKEYFEYLQEYSIGNIVEIVAIQLDKT